MSNPYSQKAVGFSSMFLNAEPRVPCQLLLDTSGSMEGSKIAALSRGVADFLAATRADSLAAKRLEVAITTFGGRVETVQAFADVAGITPPMLMADGDTPMGAAIVEGFRLVAERQTLYKQAQLSSYAPWYVLITDGEATDDLAAAKKLIEAAEKANKGLFYAIGVEGADMAELKALSVREPLALDGLQYGELFKWLSTSLSTASKSPGTKPPAKPAAHLDKGQAKARRAGR